MKFSDPLELIASQPPAWQKLRDGYEADMASGLEAPALAENECSLVVKLPDEPWARRVSGVLGNELARQFPTGGGRKAAAGINALPADQLEEFLEMISGFWN